MKKQKKKKKKIAARIKKYVKFHDPVANSGLLFS